MRKEKEVSKEYDEIWEKVWWRRHKILSAGKESDYPEEAFENAKRIEEKYGTEALNLSEEEWLAMEGKMSALAWVLGSEWEESSDT